MHICTPMTKCKRDSSDRLTKVNCTVDENVVCLGSRNFHKKGETSDFINSWKHLICSAKLRDLISKRILNLG
jgi:hypothetical protein